VPIKPIDLSDFVGIDPEAALRAIVDLGFIDGKRDERNAIDRWGNASPFFGQLPYTGATAAVDMPRCRHCFTRS
jgi:hypothetical protein